MKRIFAVVFIISAFGNPALAQDPNPQTGFPPYGSFADEHFDAINRQNLNVNFSIPIVSVPGRGIGFSHSLVYDSLIWVSGSFGWTPVVDANGDPTWGWKLENPHGFIHSLSGTDTCFASGGGGGGRGDDAFLHFFTLYTGYSYTDPRGTRHWFGLTFTDDPIALTQCTWPQSGPRTGFAIDGSGYWLDATNPTQPYVLTPGGVRIDLDGKTTDTNGNFISRTVGSTTNWQDTVGRTVLRIENIASTTIKYHVKDAGGTERTFTLTLASKSIKTNFACSGVAEYTGSGFVPTSLALPNGKSYTFDYEVNSSFPSYITGRLRKVTLPTGGTYEYNYSGANKGVNCTDGTVVDMDRKITETGTGQQWDYNRTPSGSNWITTIDAPKVFYDAARNRSEFIFSGAGRLVTEKHYQGTSTLLKTVDIIWAANGTPSVSTVTQDGMLSKTVTAFDSFGNLTQVKEYFWGIGGVGSLIRTTDLTHVTSTAYTDRNIRNLISTVFVRDPAGIVKEETRFFYDEGNRTATTGVPQHDYTNFSSSFATRGNPTTIKRWISGTTYAISTMTYDDLGNVRAVTDPEGHTSNLDYTDKYSDLVNRNSLAHVTKITKPSPFNGQAVEFSYHYPTGQLASNIDENSRTTSFQYVDNLSRLTTISFPDEGQTSISYNDTDREVTTTRKRTASQSLTVVDVFNKLGQLTQRQLPGGRKVDVTYDELGRFWKVSNPYVTAGESTAGDVETQMDALNRIVKQVNQDSTSSTINYQGNTQQIFDENLRERQLEFNGLGQITKICEVTAGNSQSPNESCDIGSFGGSGYVTTHTYDILGNITQTNQGTQVRTTVFDGLSRPTLAKIIEISTSTSVSFTYDKDSNLLSRQDPRGTVNIEYDALHRLTRKKHGTTVVASYSYDGTAANNAIGRLITEKDGDFSSGADKTDYTFDRMGRVLTSKRTISGTSYTTTVTYDFLGNFTSLSYPVTSGTRRKVNYTFNGDGELTKATDVTGTAFDYVYNASYSPLGTLKQLDFSGAASLRTMLGWNKRFQLTSILTEQVSGPIHMNLGYSYYNNGRIQQITDNQSSTGTKKYTYDELNRLLTAQLGPDGSIQRKYSYEDDKYSNRVDQNLDTGTGNPAHFTFNSANNRITTSPYAHDTSGNVINNNTGKAFTFNLENMLTSATGGISYTYDAQQRRVKKNNNGTVTHYFHLGGAVISELQGSTWTDYIFFGGSRIGKRSGSTTTFFHTDHLGSARVTTDNLGNNNGSCDYDPYGGARSGCNVQSNYGFAGMELDSETGLYHTWFRQYDTITGRWMGVDPLSGNASDPQSFNRYAYVLNDPVNFVDPLGLQCEWVQRGGDVGVGSEGQLIQEAVDFFLRCFTGVGDSTKAQGPGGGGPNRKKKDGNDGIITDDPLDVGTAIFCSTLALPSRIFSALSGGKAVGFGFGGSAGAGAGKNGDIPLGLGFGFNFSILSDGSGQSAVVLTGQASDNIILAGAIVGPSVTNSNAGQIKQLTGVSRTFSGSGGFGGRGFQVDISGNGEGTLSGTLTGGPAAGFKATFGTAHSNTVVLFSAQCGG